MKSDGGCKNAAAAVNFRLKSLAEFFAAHGEKSIKYIFADFGNPSHFIPFKTSVSFMYNGNITAIIDKLHLLHLDDVLLEEPSLEEIFMHYYA